MLTKTANAIYIAFGILALILGVIGIFLPLLPTTPLLILSAYCFSKGSKKLHHWLLTRPRIGPMIKDWEDNKVIRPRAKVLSTVMIILLFGYTLIYVNVVIWIKILSTLIGISVLSFILTRKSHI
ncbi:YbaN family protein [Halobacteriovorax sp.]|uniref:YbaN family protein n=1 Tax=Halobacteriovorax sp. TaxID=2020862 RepID=UPI0035655855